MTGQRDHADAAGEDAARPAASEDTGDPATSGDAADLATDDERVRETATLDVVAPAIEREDVESTGHVGAVAYPYLVYEASVSMPRALMDDRETEYVVSLDRARRIPLRADELPETETRTVDDALVLPAEVTREQADEMARDAVFDWTLRSYSLHSAPDIDLSEPVDAHKLFWIAERPDGDVLVDSVRGTERPLDE